MRTMRGTSESRPLKQPRGMWLHDDTEFLFFLADRGMMSAGRLIAGHRFEPGRLDEALEFLKRIRSELRMVRKTRVFRDRVQVLDVNGDWFEVEGVGYPDAEVVEILSAVNAAFKRESIHLPIDDEYKEFNAGRRYAWAADRVM